MNLRWQSRSRPVITLRTTRLALAGTMIGITASSLCPFAGITRPILYNPSSSAPIGYYRTLPPTPLSRGDWVSAFAPDEARQLADSRGYLPAAVPMIKQVAALAGDRVCAFGPDIEINGHVVARRLRVDHRGRAMPWWSRCQTLSKGQVFLLNPAAPASFDGRYFGVVSSDRIRARVVHL